jgi:hypothetical protein
MGAERQQSALGEARDAIRRIAERSLEPMPVAA